MKFLFCKNRCPSICFCHPSSHIYTPQQPSPSSSPFQLESGKPSSIPCQPSHQVSVNELDSSPFPAPKESDQITKRLELQRTQSSPLPAPKESDQITKRLEPKQTLESEQKNNALVNGSTVNSIDEDNLHHDSSNGKVDCNGNCTADANIEVLKGCLRRAVSDSVLVQKKKVQWVDRVGKELTETMEFECSEDIYYGSMNRGGCECTIL